MPNPCVKLWKTSRFPKRPARAAWPRHRCAHGNCGKDENREAEVIEEIAERLAHGEQGITGVMMESFLVGGHQKPAPLDQLVYGQSVTDSCVPWERTNELLHTLADAVTARRSAK